LLANEASGNQANRDKYGHECSEYHVDNEQFSFQARWIIEVRNHTWWRGCGWHVVEIHDCLGMRLDEDFLLRTWF
jgi:hypothetical protein